MRPTGIHIEQFDRAYFIGIGGIGMSAIARYFNEKGWEVAGYDKTPSPLTSELVKEGIDVHFEDLQSLPETFQDTSKTLVIYTPAIPADLRELRFVQRENYTVVKRAEVLGLITRNSKALGVAGTHGKTTTSTLLVHVLNESSLGCNAFLGGIASNFNSNFVRHKSSPLTVIEADEFDRSFLQLNPFASIVTSMDADHLDIYSSTETFEEGFRKYVELIDRKGFAVVHKRVAVDHPHKITYSVGEEADYQGVNLRYEEGRFLADVKTPSHLWESVEFGVPGIHNVENAIACIAMTEQLGVEEAVIRAALKSFKGVKRRFEYHIRTNNLVYIDDYAHHPTELEALIDSVKLAYPGKKITGIFQPHLFSRTRDFFDGFVEQLARIDKLILLPIYPAREKPIEGVTSEALLEKIESADKCLLSKEECVNGIDKETEEVVLTIGAGDIDRVIPVLFKHLSE